MSISDDRLEKLAVDEVEWFAKAKALDVDDLETSGLYVTPPHLSFSRDVAAESLSVSISTGQMIVASRLMMPPS